MVIGLLAISNFRNRRVRLALTVTAILLSVSLVVAVTSGYASMHAAAQQYLQRYLGNTDATITRGGQPIGEDILARMAADPAVAGAVGRLEFESRIIQFGEEDHGAMEGLAAQVIGISRPGDSRVDSMEMNAGGWFETSEGRLAVIDQIAAERLKVGVGGTFPLPTPDGPVDFTVVGIVHKPTILASKQQTIYVPLGTLQRLAFPGQPPSVTRILIDLKGQNDFEGFAERWKKQLGAIDPRFKVRLASDSRQELDKNLQGLKVMSYLGGMVSMLSATFIVFSALSMGVSERQRTLAMLRAIGAHKSQIARLVVLEGLVLAALGSVIGAPLGYLWVKLLAMRFDTFFSAGVMLSWGGVILGVGGSLVAALAASLLPAWSASRVSPLAAMSPLAGARANQSGVPWRSALVGLILMSLDSLVLFGPVVGLLDRLGVADPMGQSRVVRFYSHFAVGLPGIMIGAFLLAPLFVWLLERVLGPVVCLILGIRFALLRQQLTSGIWRAAGTAAALMVGLATLIAMQVQGSTFLNSWRLPDKFPDIFVVSWFGPLSPQQQEKLESVPGIRRGEVMPIAIAVPSLWKNVFAVEGADVLGNATLFVGVDPGKAFKMMELDFLEGNAVDAAAMLTKGRHIVVTDEFRQLRRLHVGDPLTLETTKHGPQDYIIAGVVWSPGIDLIVGMFDMGRQFDQRTSATVFGSLADAKEDFGVDSAYLFAANLEYNVEKTDLLANIQSTLGKWGMVAGDVRQIKYNMQQGFAKLLLLASTVAFAAMAVASLGVTNTIMASVRSRRWQFGILRAIGLTRGQLLRLVLAEAILLGLVGATLGLVAGLDMAINAKALATAILGLAPPLSIPWGIVGLGSGIVMAIALLASLWPAIHVSRAQPLNLLQAGRSAA